MIIILNFYDKIVGILQYFSFFASKMIWKSNQDDADDENANDKTRPIPIKHEQERHEENAENVVQSDVQPRSKLREHLPATYFSYFL
jgi:hypothetical protein